MGRAASRTKILAVVIVTKPSVLSALSLYVLWWSHYLRADHWFGHFRSETADFRLWRNQFRIWIWRHFQKFVAPKKNSSNYYGEVLRATVVTDSKTIQHEEGKNKMTWLICLVWKVIKCAKFCTFYWFYFHTFKCILNLFWLHVLFWALVAFYFPNYNFSNQLNSICIWLSIFSCIFSSDWFSLVLKKSFEQIVKS